jgi:integrin alpha 8
MKSFGYSLSGGLDLDENSYPDLIVGAYKSDAVVFIRSKPVIQTLFKTHTIPKFIDLNSEENHCSSSSSISNIGAKVNSSRICINLEYCIRYFGKALPSSLRMLYSIELDVEKHYNKSLTRVYFAHSKTYKLFLNHTFKYNENKCFKEILYMKKTIRDKLTPIKIRFNYSLPQYDSDWELMPIFNMLPTNTNSNPNSNSTTATTNEHEIRFLRNCGADDICTPDLRLKSASSSAKTYVYGSRRNIDISVSVENVGEDAFESQCQITLPHGVDFVKAFLNQNSSLPCYHQINTEASSSVETKLICDIGNPMVGKSFKSFTIRVAPQSVLLFNQKVLKFNISLSSSNKENNSTIIDNESYVFVLLEAMPNVALIGKKYQEQVIYDSKVNELHKEKSLLNDYARNDDESHIGPEIMHEFKVRNKGPSQFLASELLVAWEKQIKIGVKNRDFLYLMEIPYTEGPIKCDFSRLEYNRLNITVRLFFLIFNAMLHPFFISN